jgi:hypothetical protein
MAFFYDYLLGPMSKHSLEKDARNEKIYDGFASVRALI